MDNTKEIKPISVETFSYEDLISKKLPSVPGCKTLTSAMDRLFIKKHCQVVVSTWPDRTEYMFRYHDNGNVEIDQDAICVTVYTELNRISITVVGNYLTDTDKIQLLNTVPSSVRRHYKQRKIQTLDELLKAAIYIKNCLVELNSLNDDISQIKSSLK